MGPTAQSPDSLSSAQLTAKKYLAQATEVLGGLDYLVNISYHYDFRNKLLAGKVETTDKADGIGDRPGARLVMGPDHSLSLGLGCAGSAMQVSPTGIPHTRERRDCGSPLD